MSFKARLAASAAALALASGGLALAAASSASASTVTCTSCTHVQNEYAFRGALDAVHQGTALNTPIVLWYEKASTTDPGADLLVVPGGTVAAAVTSADFGVVNQSNLNWVSYIGDSVVRFKYDPYGNGGANTYVGLNGTNVALRADNPNSKWQEFIEAPVTSSGAPLSPSANACSSGHCVLIDVGQTANPNDPIVVTDPNNANTGSLVQQDVTFGNVNQAGDYATNQVWDFQN